MEIKVLIAEDDRDIVQLLSLYFKRTEFTPVPAYNGIEALEIMKNEKIDIAIVDLMMPEMDGYTLITRLREISNIPVMILSARDEEYDKIRGLGIGADMYLTKPFKPTEVIAYTKALYRRYYHLGSGTDKAAEDPVLRAGELSYDPVNMVVKKNGKAVPMTATEMRILSRMMSQPGHIFTKKQLYEHNDYMQNDDGSVMVHVFNLRSKIEDDPKKPKYIKTIRGIGYKFDYTEEKSES